MKKLLVILGIALLTGCDSGRETKEMIGELESGIKQTDSLFVILQKNPDDSILLCMDATLERVKTVLADTMSAETEKILEDYLELQSSLRDYSAGKDTLQKEILFSKKQIEDLSKDISSGNGSPEVLKANAKTELEAVSMLDRNILKMDNWFDSANGAFITANELLKQRIETDSLLNLH